MPTKVQISPSSSKYLWRSALLTVVVALGGVILRAYLLKNPLQLSGVVTTAIITNTPVMPTSTWTNTPLTPTATSTYTPVPPTPTKTNTPVMPTATKTNTPVAPTPTVTTTYTPKVYYVSTTGSDQNPGTIDQPWRTIQQAANTMVGGDTVYIRGGTYPEQVIPQHSGNASDGYITYTAYQGETVIIDGSTIQLAYPTGNSEGLFWIHGNSYITVSGLRVLHARGDTNDRQAFGIKVDSNAQNIIIKNSYVEDTVNSGIWVGPASYILVDGNEVVDACRKMDGSNGYDEPISIVATSFSEIKNNNVHNNLDVVGGGGEGINIKEGSHDITVHNNQSHDNPHVYGMGVDGYSGGAYNISFYNNVVYNNMYGIIVEAEQGGLVQNINVYNNIVYNNSSDGLYMPDWGGNFTSTKRNINFINNTVYSNGTGYYGWNTYVENVVVRNNIFLGNTTNIIISSGAVAQTSVDHNLFYGNGGTFGSNPVTGDPKFANPAGGDFHLQGGSPAIDAGSSSSAPSTDFDGKLRPQGAGYDIGAYEY